MENTIKYRNGATRTVSHRGLSGIERENTCQAFIAAGNRATCYGIETDVHRTKDGHYVCIHDANTKRVSNYEMVIEESTFAEVRSIMLTDRDGQTDRADLRIPTLYDYIKICKRYGKQAVLELKNPVTTVEQLKEITDIITELDYMDGTTFIAFPREAMISLRKLYPKAKAQFLTTKWDEEVAAFITEYDLDIDISSGVVTEEVVRQIKALGKEINVWTVDTAERAEELVSWGVDYITSNILESEA